MTGARATLFGSEVIERLIPHRRPFLMVDAVESFVPGARPQLRAHRSITANEPVFAGHFPGLHLWPGVYTIEGLGQSCLLLSILDALDAESVEALRNLDRGYRLHPGYRPGSATTVLERLGPATERLGLTAAIDVKLLAPVFAGQRLDYAVTRTHEVGDLIRFDVAATVDGRTVASGTLTGKGGVVAPPASADPRP